MKLHRNVNQLVHAAIVLMLLINGCSSSNRAQSDHFDGKHYFNMEPENTFLDHIKWLWNMETVQWPKWINDPPQPPLITRVNKGELRVTYINQSTVLIQIDGVNILTDPIFSDYAGPFSWASSKRIRAPGKKISDLPKIDVILISHNHYDHLDIPSVKVLSDSHRPIILVGLGVKRNMKAIMQSRIVELDWWQQYTYSENLKIAFVPSRHNSGRGMFNKNKTLWGGFVIEVPTGNVLFMGDTAFGSFIKDIGDRYSQFRLAILPIGSYEKRWFMKSQHMNPDDAVRVHGMLNVAQSIGVHFSTFNEHPEQAIDAHEKDLKTALEEQGVAESEFWILKFGEGRYVNR